MITVDFKIADDKRVTLTFKNGDGMLIEAYTMPAEMLLEHMRTYEFGEIESITTNIEE
jgi:hypothetical protein